MQCCSFLVQLLTSGAEIGRELKMVIVITAAANSITFTVLWSFIIIISLSLSVLTAIFQVNLG